jgi:hypothetical protein
LLKKNTLIDTPKIVGPNHKDLNGPDLLRASGYKDKLGAYSKYDDIDGAFNLMK